jgi:hypothetical protein
MGNAGGKKKSGKKGAKTENASSGGTKTLASNSEYDKLFRILMAGDLGNYRIQALQYLLLILELFS